MKDIRSIILITILFFIGSSGCASLMPHPRSWTKREKIAAGFFLTAHTLNAFSTEHHQDHPDLYYERNPILGSHPSDREIGVYFSITGIVALLIADWYPEIREPLLYGYGGVNLGMAIDDYRMTRK